MFSVKVLLFNEKFFPFTLSNIKKMNYFHLKKSSSDQENLYALLCFYPNLGFHFYETLDLIIFVHLKPTDHFVLYTQTMQV